MPVFSGTAAADRIVGSAEADQIYGLGLNDMLYGGGGDDWLVGGLGGDFLVGGLGDDSYDVDSVRDQVVERAFEGTDRVRAWISYELTANVEILTLAGTANLNGTGNAKNNTILGNAGNNVLNGGAGDDAVAGGAGNDIYDVDSTRDVVSEGANAGYDRIRASASYTLSANVEDLDLTGTKAINGTGNALANTIVGNAGANVLTGGAGDDVLIGGAGGDRMVGGVGNDVYHVDAVGDRVVEVAGQGVDLVRSSISHSLGADVENLTLTDSANINGTGNALANTIVGNAGINVLGGGAGDDQLFGGDGDDDLHGGAGKDYLEGGAGNDWLVENKINLMAGEVYDGGDGHDTLWVRGDFSASIDLSTILLLNFEDIISDYQTTRISSAQITSISNLRAYTVQISDGGNLDLSNLVADFDRINLSDMGNNLTLRPMGPFFFEPVVYGGLGTDTVVGGSSFNEIHGGGGNDSITGGAEFGELFGDSGDDVVRGGGGGDRIVGGQGNDQLTGGSGGDSFEFGISEGVDTIVDFRSSQGDIIFLPNLLNGEFVYLGSADFTGAGNTEARFAAGQVFVDADGNGTTDITIRLTGITAASQLHDSDFVFW